MAASSKSKMEVKERIITGSEELFFRFGVKSVTMDDVARHLSISKKTIYQFFKDKDDLVAIVTQDYLAKQEAELQELLQSASDPIEEVLKISEYMRTATMKINPSILFDIQKFHPKAWKIYQSHKKQCIQETIVVNLKKGMEQGYYRAGMDVDILATLRMEQIQLAFNPTVFPPEKFELAKVQVEFIDHFLYGICTLKGHKLINKYKHINEED